MIQIQSATQFKSAEEGSAPRVPKDRYYSLLKMILERVKQGDTLDASYAEDGEAHRQRIAEREEQERSAPEPGNWRSQAWRHWKIRQLTRLHLWRAGSVRSGMARV